MNIFQKYIAYLRNNPQRYWFKCKIWGWGWVPATWEGWTVLALFILGLIGIVVQFVQTRPPSNARVIGFIAEVLVWIALLAVVCYVKGEPPTWHWGFPKEK